ncbi:hypothetical protein HYS00_02030 [Candidatus Microgenomates bacterium]|nr:hypothetical protein [Candidatus Microgenomates bacterium]
MNINITLDLKKITRVKEWVEAHLPWERVILLTALLLAVIATAYSFSHDYIVMYGDAESHLNIAKRTINSITPGFAQLGGIWLPIPHMMMVPFIWSDFLWRTGLAGSIVSGFCYVISGFYLFKLVRLITKSTAAATVGFLTFALNLNILYMQSTPMTELPLIMFFMLSSYYFVRFVLDDKRVLSLIAAGFFGFMATLSRYDGWFLVMIEAGVIVLMYLPAILKRNGEKWKMFQGKFLAFITPAFFGMIIWTSWDYLILGDPFYFTNSQFSAKSQQSSWLARGELPAYHNIFQSIIYYLVTAMSNIGLIVFVLSIIGLIWYLRDKKQQQRLLIALVMIVPFIFYIVTLWLGQSVIFIPHLTPVSFEWRLFNVRYGLMAVPFAAFFTGYLFFRCKPSGRALVLGLSLAQFALYIVGYSQVITLADGTVGLSHAKRPDAEVWMRDHYNGGLVLMDDYARTMSLLRSNIPMQESIYIGNKPFWDESLREPEKYATWIVMQKDDTVWNSIYDDPLKQGRLFKYFNKAYTSPEILIFKRIKPLGVDEKTLIENGRKKKP